MASLSLAFIMDIEIYVLIPRFLRVEQMRLSLCWLVLLWALVLIEGSLSIYLSATSPRLALILSVSVTTFLLIYLTCSETATWPPKQSTLPWTTNSITWPTLPLSTPPSCTLVVYYWWCWANFFQYWLDFFLYLRMMSKLYWFLCNSIWYKFYCYSSLFINYCIEFYYCTLPTT